jgi:HEPN domain-containing protein
MLTIRELQQIAKARLEDAEALFHAGRYDGSIYLCGYAIEIGLKNKICKTLHWKGFPSTRSEFQDFQTFKTHSLNVLLRLSGAENKIKKNLLIEWSIVSKWDPEARYKETGSTTKQGAKLMIDSTNVLLGAL